MGSRMIDITRLMDSRSFVGVFGTAMTVLLENISVVVSILVGVATLAYMLEKWLHMRQKRQRDEKFSQKELEDK